jgi:PadR family transcriptional regulator, regulatory protein PadR
VTNTDTDPVVNVRRFEARGKEVVVPKARTELLQGTLDMLILKTLALGPMHGWGISQRIAQISEDVLQVYQGSLYPALQRLETAGWIDSEWGASDNNRQARFYRLTKKGQKQLRDETANWERMTGAVAKILSAES